MASDDIKDRLTIVMGQVLKLPPEAIGPEASRKTLTQWDSLKHMTLMLALEDEFGIEFSDVEIASMDSFTSLTDKLRTRKN